MASGREGARVPLCCPSLCVDLVLPFFVSPCCGPQVTYKPLQEATADATMTWHEDPGAWLQEGQEGALFRGIDFSSQFRNGKPRKNAIRQEFHTVATRRDKDLPLLHFAGNIQHLSSSTYLIARKMVHPSFLE